MKSPHDLDPCTKICTKIGNRPICRDHYAINKNNALGAVFRLARSEMAETKSAEVPSECIQRGLPLTFCINGLRKYSSTWVLINPSTAAHIAWVELWVEDCRHVEEDHQA